MPARSTDAIRDTINGLIASILAGNDIHNAFAVDDPLPAVGLTSMDMVNLMLGIEAQFDITIPQEDITPEHFRSVSSITVLVARILGSGARA